MPDYVPNALAKFKHPKLCIPQHAPRAWKMPKMTQYATTDDSNFLEVHSTKQVQAISSIFLYYALAVQPAILPELNEISNQQAKIAQGQFN